jgi:hypothetical protein
MSLAPRFCWTVSPSCLRLVKPRISRSKPRLERPQRRIAQRSMHGATSLDLALGTRRPGHPPTSSKPKVPYQLGQLLASGRVASTRVGTVKVLSTKCGKPFPEFTGSRSLRRNIAEGGHAREHAKFCYASRSDLLLLNDDSDCTSFCFRIRGQHTVDAWTSMRRTPIDQIDSSPVRFFHFSPHEY